MVLSADKVLLGGKGYVNYRYRLHRSNVSGDVLEAIEGVTSATVSLDNQRDYMWECTVEMEAKEDLDPFTDYCKLVIEVEMERDVWQSYPLGLYRFSKPQETFAEEGARWSLRGRSLEFLLTRDQAYKGYRVEASVSILAHVRGLLIDLLGVPGHRITFPPDDVQTTAPIFFDTQVDASLTFYLRIVNHLLNIGGFTALYTDGEGRFRCDVADPKPDRPDVHYAVGEHDDIIVGEAQGEYEDERFANRVVVYSGDVADTAPLTAAAELVSMRPATPVANVTYVEAPDSPATIDALGYVVQGEPVVLQKIVSSTVAQRLAKRHLQRQCGFDHKLTIRTFPDPRRAPHEVYRVTLTDAEGREMLAQSKWVVQGWTMPLDLAEMEHTLTRFERVV